jgi:hypothetical protein
MSLRVETLCDEPLVYPLNLCLLHLRFVLDTTGYSSERQNSDNCRDVLALLTLFYSSLHSWWTWQSPEAKFSVPLTFFLLEKMIRSSLWQVSGSKVLDLLRFGIMEFLNPHLSLVVCWVMLQGGGNNGPSTGIQSNWWASWETGCKCVNFVTMKL